MAENDEILETGSSTVQQSASLEAPGMQQKEQRRQDARSHPFFPRDWPVPIFSLFTSWPSGQSARGNLHSCEREVSLDRSVTSG
jgi:hypothetical protein